MKSPLFEQDIDVGELIYSLDGPPELQPQLEDRSFPAAACTQLGADHFCLEKIQKRLIEYLAVIRLKELNTEREITEEQKRPRLHQHRLVER